MHVLSAACSHSSLSAICHKVGTNTINRLVRLFRDPNARSHLILLVHARATPCSHAQRPSIGDHDAGTNKLEDVDIYAFDPPVPADKGTLDNVAVNSTDAVLQSLLRTDVDQDRWIAGWENHKENLPEDPSQARLAASQLPCALTL